MNRITFRYAYLWSTRPVSRIRAGIVSLRDPKATSLTTDQAWRKLVAGNDRFVAGRQRHPHESLEWRESLVEGQHPFAVILGCADSRVSPELVFDEGLGDLFQHDTEVTGDVATLVRAIKPAVRATPANPDAAAFLAACVAEQARRAAKYLQERSNIISDAVADHGVQVVSATYELRTGEVTRL